MTVSRAERHQAGVWGVPHPREPLSVISITAVRVWHKLATPSARRRGPRSRAVRRVPWLPPLRAALLGPGHRDRWYSANARYARALRLAVIPALAGRLATSVRVGMGASLGGLAMLHTHRRHPDAFDAPFLQSGSFSDRSSTSRSAGSPTTGGLSDSWPMSTAADCRPGACRSSSPAA